MNTVRLTVSILSLMLTLSLEAQAATTSDKGTVTFSSRIVDTPCTIDQESQNAAITLPSAKKSDLGDPTSDTAAFASSTPFYIKLLNCPSAGTVKVTFRGSTPTNAPNTVLAAKGGSDAAGGVGFQIMLKGVPLIVDGTTASEVQTISNTDVSIPFTTRLFAWNPKAVHVTAGSLEATADFTLTYE